MKSVKVVSSRLSPSKGSAGLSSQLYGCAATVSSFAEATGGISPGSLVEPS